jgi:hypothetical protein
VAGWEKKIRLWRKLLLLDLEADRLPIEEIVTATVMSLQDAPNGLVGKAAA